MNTGDTPVNLKVNRGVHPLIGQKFAKSFSYGKPDGTSMTAPYGDISAFIGSGGFADVYQLDLHPFFAKQLKAPSSKVAVKLLTRARFSGETPERSIKLITRFTREGEIGKLLDYHPNLLTYYEFDMSDATYMYMIMEYFKGKDLTDYVLLNPSEGEKPQETLSIESAFRIMAHVTDAVDYAHKKGITHRDIQPANILVSEDGLEKLIDFGIGKIAGEKDEHDDHLSVEGEVIGVPHYLSPELGQTGYNKEKDVWGICVTLYSLLAGRPPYIGDSTTSQEQLALFNKIVDPAKSMRVGLLKNLRKDVPWEISDLCAEGLIKESERRINSSELNREFKRIANKLGIQI